MIAPLRVAAAAAVLAGSLAVVPAAEAGHGRAQTYFRGRGFSYRYSRPYRVVAPRVRFYYTSPVYDPYYYAPYYSPSPYAYAPYSYGYAPAYGYGYGYGYRHFHGGAACYLPHVSVRLGW